MYVLQNQIHQSHSLSWTLHIRCKVIPVGFSIKFHASSLSNGYVKNVRYTTYTCSIILLYYINYTCPTENIASYLDMVMSPFVCILKTHAKDTNHALQILRTFQFANNDASQRFLYTMDIKSLYTVIPHNSGLEALKYFLNKLLELVVTLNAFSFNISNFGFEFV